MEEPAKYFIMDADQRLLGYIDAKKPGSDNHSIIGFFTIQDAQVAAHLAHGAVVQAFKKETANAVQN